MKNGFLKNIQKILYSMLGIVRVKTPTVLQMEAVECGAASLGIILACFGKFVPLEILRTKCGVSRNGSKASNIVRAARKYGFDVKAYRKEPDQLKSMPLPMIVFWNFYHFLVVEGFGKDKVYLNDPANGPRTVSYEEFDNCFTGVVMTFEPGPDFEKSGSKQKLIPALKKRLAGFESALIYIVLASIALVIPGLAIPVFVKIFIDEILVVNSTDWIFPLLAGMTFTAVIRTALTWLQQDYLLKFETNLSLNSSSKFFWHVLHLPIGFYTQRSPGDLGFRVGINDRVAMLLSGELANTFLGLLLIFFYAGLMFYYNVTLTLIGIGIALINIVALKYISRKRVDANQKYLQDYGKLHGIAVSGLQMIETLKASASESDFFARWAGYQSKMLNTQQKLGMLTQSLQVVPVFLTLFNTLVILVIGSIWIMSGKMSIGTLVAFQSLMASFMLPVNSLVNLGSSLQDVEGGIKRLDDVFKYPVEEKLLKLSLDSTVDKKVKLQGNLELKNVTFGYSSLDPPLIEDFSLSLKPGSRVAIVGKTGCGKSTVAKLVSGLYEPWEGKILFDGNERKDTPPSTLHNSISMVDQDIFMFEGSVRDNITFWDDTISEEQVIQTAKNAIIHEDIASRPGAYESPVAEGGKNFSGGQKQRMEIARALINNPAVLILDEATSALDSKTEKAIDENIRKTGCTCLIIAHRLSTIRDCDEIIVLDKGKVVQRGTHEELKDQPGRYAKLIKD